ncbi:hypothetical protein AB0N99_30770 [Streptomyces sp. NPDC093272]|uniref:DUF7739 domain-containing protein n=1 Tax=Streptomyces sp. NPDC093272 TaxID=3154981 RepID=UPI00342E6926
MGISISHGVSSTRSATTIANLGQHLAHTFNSGEWREVVELFGGGFADSVSIPPRQAGRIGVLLHRAARHRLMLADWGDLAVVIGNAASAAERAGENWEWS